MQRGVCTQIISRHDGQIPCARRFKLNRALGILAILWAGATSSTAHAAPSSPSPDPRDASVLHACGPGDPILHAAARHVAFRALERKKPWTMVELGQRLRTWGVPHPNARAWTLKAPRIDRQHAVSRLQTWLTSHHDGVSLRCGVASVQDSDRGEVLTVVTVPVFADLATPIPTTLPQSRWVTVDAQMKQRASGAKIVVLGPRGAPRTIPTSYDPATGRILGRFMADREGRWFVQVLATLGTGPRPVIETQLRVGDSVKDRQVAVPGESAGHGLNDADAMLAMLNAARSTEGLRPLQRDPVLERLADEHVRAMMAAGIVGHDAGKGTPPARVADAGISSSEVGENVSRAASPTLAHRALWDSPSHRANTLHTRYERVGVAARRDARGLLWVAQIFVGRSIGN